MNCLNTNKNNGGHYYKSTSSSWVQGLIASENLYNNNCLFIIVVFFWCWKLLSNWLKSKIFSEARKSYTTKVLDAHGLLRDSGDFFWYIIFYSIAYKFRPSKNTVLEDYGESYMYIWLSCSCSCANLYFSLYIFLSYMTVYTLVLSCIQKVLFHIKVNIKSSPFVLPGIFSFHYSCREWSGY